MANLKTIKKDLIFNELVRELIAIRVDTLYRMLLMKKNNCLPRTNDEGATGNFDNKGALFVPGGIILEDSDRFKVKSDHFKSLSSGSFRDQIHSSMKLDNATLLFPDGIASGVNLDNGFFANISSSILTYKRAARKKSFTLRSHPPGRITSSNVTKSNTPQYILPPYGARTKISSCLSVCLTEPRLYFLQCREFFRLHGNGQQHLWDNLSLSRKSIRGYGDSILAPPFIIVCHTTRYRENILCGLIRILGIGDFGEFATITIEEMDREYLETLLDEKENFENYIITESADKIISCLLRFYPKTTPGKRLLRTRTIPLSPEKDININVKQIFRRSRNRYGSISL